MKKKVRATLAVSAGALIIGIAARVFIIVVHTDMKTGFLYRGEELLCNLLYYGVIGAAAVAAIFTARSDEKDLSEQTAADIGVVKTVIMGFAAMLAGICSLFEGFDELKAISPMRFRTFSDFIFAAVLLAVAFVALYKKKFTPGLGYSFSLIGAYCICRGMYCFMNRMVIITVPEYLIECLGLIMMSVYFVLLAKFLSGNGQKHTRKALAFWGAGASALTLSGAFGTLIASVAAPDIIRSRIVFSSYAAESFRQSSAGIEAYNLVVTPWTDFFLGVLIAVSMIAVFTKSAKNKETNGASETE